jgi:pyrophosphate--fructose-6-phosphate 1-phosphotransferase
MFDGVSFPLKGSTEIVCTFQEIHGLLRHGVAPDNISSQLSPWTSALFEFLPPYIKKQVYISPY